MWLKGGDSHCALHPTPNSKGWFAFLAPPVQLHHKSLFFCWKSTICFMLKHTPKEKRRAGKKGKKHFG